MSTNQFFIATNVDTGLLIRLERIRRGWRQLDLAEQARVTQGEVSAIERGCYVIPCVRQRILKSLNFSDEEPEAPDAKG